MKTSSDFKTLPAPFTLLLAGEPKTGKTNIIFSFPQPFILDCDHNLSRAANLVGDKKWFYDDPYLNEKGVAVEEYERWNNATRQLIEAAKHPDVQTIVIDGLGALSEMLVAHIIYETGKNEGKKLDRLRIQDYQVVKSLLTKITLALRSTNKLFVVTSHIILEKDDMTGRVAQTLNIAGSLSKTYGGLFTDAWVTIASNVGGKLKYEIYTKPSGFHSSVGTSRDLPAVIDVTDKKPSDIWALISPKVTK